MRRKSSEELRINGTGRKDRPRRGDELTPEPGIPRAPRWLSPEAKAEWRRIVRDPGFLRVLCRVDAAMLASFCDQYGRLQRGEKADVRTMVTLAGRFGLTPADRARISIPKKEKPNVVKNSLEAWLNREE